ncbi:glycogen debranching enzyme alpha-1,6-glucosidase [Klosneuvirus KNV1]|uniref:Glycogen debranching enzyme alpha-1,6-glucosidase n=1 Tax=Klosneuvirus KNV1 TaxID=1977640 RepID=A0A1V0SLH6_9VIRU|nr:glycogen debranching enzyme alpha-1,6-glucosidase [Klosneuvirus KNV1]
MLNKKEEALQVIRTCIGQKGIWASSERYRDQCWTRDFCMATSWLFMHHKDLVDLELVYNHLNNLASRQKSNGKLPILFLDDENAFVKKREEREKKEGKTPFMLKRYREGELENLTPNTRDSEVLFVITACEFLLNFNGFEYNQRYFLIYQAIHRTMKYIEDNILDNGLIHGADWRDVREDLDDKTVLTNACFLYRAYELMIKIAKQCNSDYSPYENNIQFVKNRIQKDFWNGIYFNDYPGCIKFDIFGNALVVLYGIATEDQSERIFNHVKTISGPHGIPTFETFLPPQTEKEKQVMIRDNAVIWPFTNGFMLNSMLMSGDEKWISYATEEFKKWEKLTGFYEWYDIVDGEGFGSPNQVWSAALYLRVMEKIRRE